MGFLHPGLALVLFALLTTEAMSNGRALEHFTDCAFMTGRSATVLVTADNAPVINGKPITAGDEIAVFSPDGHCAGAAVWTGSSIAIPVWEDDPYTEGVVGFERGEELSYRVYQRSSGAEFGADPKTAEVDYDPKYDDDGTFSPDAIFVIRHLSYSGEGDIDEDDAPLVLAHPYPNPFQSRTTIAYSIPQDGDVRLELFDLLGRRVAVLVDEHQTAGRYDVVFEADSHLAAGLFIARLYSAASTATARLTLMR
jgi:hypothetical protein